MHELWITVTTMRGADVFDIFMVGLLFYGIFALLRESRSFVALLGFVTFMVASLILFLIARAANLHAMILVFQQFWIFVILIFLIVFQNEFKKALTDMGQWRVLRPFFPSRERDVLDEIVNAVQLMASRNIGALMALERHNPLKPYTTTGKMLDALVSSELIRTIFTNYAPLHDGALIMRGERLVAAGCILPLTDATNLSHDLGTRHRAGIALSEQTDAIVIIVSEETGTISLVIDGKMTRGLQADDLRHRLEKELDIERAPQSGGEQAGEGDV